MGLEAECTVRLGRKTSTGKALLEGERLVFIGEFRLDIPFDQIRHVAVVGNALLVRTSDQEAQFELGTLVGERWARLITEPKGLFEKLEVGPLSRVAVVDVRDSMFLTALRERTTGLAEGRVPGGAPIIFFGADTREALRKLQLLRARMMDTGTLWLVRPKGSKDISEADVLAAIRGAGLVDTKVVSFSKTHTAHKCVIPVELRGGAPRPRPPIVSMIPPSTPSLASRKPSARATAARAKTKPKPMPKAKARTARASRAPAKAKPVKKAKAKTKAAPAGKRR